MRCATSQPTLKSLLRPRLTRRVPPCAAAASCSRVRVVRRGSALSITLVAILVVGLAAAAVAATIYAMQAAEQRDRARSDFEQSSATIDQMVAAVAASGKLKGAKSAKARQQVFQPAADHYDRIIELYGEDEEMLPAVASAKLYKASLQAKLGLPECVNSLKDGTRLLNELVKLDLSEESYPRFQESVLTIVEPMEWVTVKGASPMEQGIGLYVGIQAAISAYQSLNKKFPASIAFRDDLSELYKSAGLLLGALRKTGPALTNWTQARDVLETMVRDEPDNAAFKERLAESLTNVAKLERSEGELEKAIADYQRAVEVRQQMAEANPEDESLKKALARAQRDLESAQKVAAADEETPAADEAAKQDPEAAAKTDDSAE